MGPPLLCYRTLHRPRRRPTPSLTSHRERGTSVRSRTVLFDVLCQREVQRSGIRPTGDPVLLDLLRRVQCAMGDRSHRYVSQNHELRIVHVLMGVSYVALLTSSVRFIQRGTIAIDKAAATLDRKRVKANTGGL